MKFSAQPPPAFFFKQALPRLGLGTWSMGESRARRTAEVAAVRNAMRLGYRLIDTAEMYGDGGAEEVVGSTLAEALQAGEVALSDLLIVSKVYPHRASHSGTLAACERSLQRLGLQCMDLCLLHWRGHFPLTETCAALQTRVQQGRIGCSGVSNFDIDDLQELCALPGGVHCAVNQVCYPLGERGAAFSLLPWQRAHGLPLMAYSPLDQGALARSPALQGLATASGRHTGAGGAGLAAGAVRRGGHGESSVRSAPAREPACLAAVAGRRGTGRTGPAVSSGVSQTATGHAVSHKRDRKGFWHAALC